MCNPVAIVGGVTALAGAFTSANAQEEADAANAKVALENKRLFGFYAEDAERRGVDEAYKYRMSIKQLKGRQRVMAGASNVEMSGSTAKVLSETESVATYDLLKIANNASREAYGYRLQAEGASASAHAITAGGSDRYLGTLLTGGQQALSIYQGSRA